MKTMAIVLMCMMAMVSTSSLAELYKITSESSTENAAAFNSEAKWIDESGRTVTTKPSAGNDYLVENQRLINAGGWGSNPTSYTFGGDSLQIGVVGGWKCGEFMHDGYGTLTIGNLILANGIYRQWKSVTDRSSSSAVVGSAKVTSPVTKPFCISPSNGGTGGWTVDWGMALSSETDDVAILAGAPIFSDWPERTWPSCSPVVRFTGDNSGYKGSIVANGENAEFRFASAKALGGKPDAFNARGLVLQNGVTVVSEADDVALSKDVDRGIFVGTGGGRLNVSTGKRLRIEWPVGGTGELTVFGGGELTLASDMTDGGSSVRLVIAEGALVLAEGFANAENAPLVIRRSAALSVKAGNEVEVGSLEMEDSVLQVEYDAASGKSGVVVLTNDDLLQAPMAVRVPNVRKIKVPFLKLPVGAGTLSAENFVEPLDLVASGRPSAVFTVETEGDCQVAYVETADLVEAVVSAPSAGTASDWSDNRTMHAKADYVIAATNAWKSFTVDAAQYALPCESLMTRGLYSGSMQFSWYLTCNDFSGDVRTGERTKMYIRPKSGTEMHVGGRFDVSNGMWSDLGVVWYAYAQNMTMFVDAQLTGTGCLCLQPFYDNGNNVFCFTGDNTFSGLIFAYGTEKPTTDIILKLAKAASFGSNPANWQSNGFVMQGKVTLYPVGSQSVSLPNKEFYFVTSKTQLKVDDGEVFELHAPVKMNKGVETAKVGGGTWALRDAVTVNDGTAQGTPKLKVSEGYVRPDIPKAFANIVVEFADATGIAAKYRPDETGDLARYGMVVTDASRLVVSGDVLKLKVDAGGAKLHGGATIPVLTVPASLAVTLDAKRIQVDAETAGGNGQWVVRRDSVTVDGAACVRYSARFEKGMAVIIR